MKSNLLFWRKQNRRTIIDLAQELNVTSYQISLIEMGLPPNSTKQATARTLTDIADYILCDFFWLYSDEYLTSLLDLPDANYRYFSEIKIESVEDFNLTIRLDEYSSLLNTDTSIQLSIPDPEEYAIERTGPDIRDYLYFLSERERGYLELYLGDSNTPPVPIKEIAKSEELTSSYIQRIIARAIMKLKRTWIKDNFI